MKAFTIHAVIGAAGVFLLCMTGYSAAADVEIPITQSASITSGHETRLLFEIDIPDSLRAKPILYVACELYLTLDSCNGKALSFLAAPLTRDWSSGSVTWSTGWDSAGGDYAMAGSADVAIDPGRGKGTFLTTSWLKAVIRGRKDNLGFILVPTGPDSSNCRHAITAPGNVGHVVIKY